MSRHGTRIGENRDVYPMPFGGGAVGQIDGDVTNPFILTQRDGRADYGWFHVLARNPATKIQFPPLSTEGWRFRFIVSRNPAPVNAVQIECYFDVGQLARLFLSEQGDTMISRIIYGEGGGSPMPANGVRLVRIAPGDGIEVGDYWEVVQYSQRAADGTAKFYINVIVFALNTPQATVPF